MVCSTINREYNDSSVQNQTEAQQGGISNQAGASQPFNIEAEFRKLQQLVQAQVKEIVALKKKEQQRKGKEIVDVEKDPEEERAEKHTQAHAGNAEKDPIIDAEKQQQKSVHDEDRDGEPKNPEKHLEIWVSRRHEGALHLPRVEGANPPPVPPGGQQAGQHAGPTNTWRRTS
jgi:hypothetical protein